MKTLIAVVISAFYDFQ